MRRKPQSGSKQKKQLKWKRSEARSDRRLILVFVFGQKDKRIFFQELRELKGVMELRQMFDWGGIKSNVRSLGLTNKKRVEDDKVFHFYWCYFNAFLWPFFLFALVVFIFRSVRFYPLLYSFFWCLKTTLFHKIKSVLFIFMYKKNALSVTAHPTKHLS